MVDRRSSPYATWQRRATRAPPALPARTRTFANQHPRYAVICRARRAPSLATATRRGRRRFALIVCALVAATTLGAQSAPPIPLVTGLTIVSALHYPEGDRENVVFVTDASTAGARYTWKFDHHGNTAGSNLPDKGGISRFVRASDLAGAPRLDPVFPSDAPEESPGFTAFSISRAVYRRLL